jgi:RNA polymerase sigma factor (sigma-70 family)
VGEIFLEIPRSDHRLEKEEELELIEKYKETRDQGIFYELLKANHGILRKLAWAHRHHGVDVDELIICGQGIVEEAIITFDPSKGARFSTYLWFLARTAMDRNCARLQGITEAAHKDMMKAIKVGEAYYREHGSYPSTDDLAKMCGISRKRIENINGNIKKARTVSLQKVIFADRSRPVTLEDTIVSVDDMESSVICRDIWEKAGRIIKDLPPRQRDTIRMRFGIERRGKVGMTMQEVGDIFQVTREAVRQTEKKALARLRNMLT